MTKLNIINKLGKVSLQIKKYTPEILLGAGAVGTVATTVLACKATLKLDDILTEAKEKIEQIKDFEDDQYSEEDRKKDLIIYKTQTALKIAKLYLPCATLGLTSLACFFTAHHIMSVRNLALIASFKTLEQSYEKYRNKVKEKIGEDGERRLFYNLDIDKVEDIIVSEDGKEKKVKKDVEVISSNGENGCSIYARYYDDKCSQWDPSPEYNLTFLRCQQNYANDLLHSRGHVFLNEIYDLLGIPRTSEGALVGWVKDGDKDNFIDFNIYSKDSNESRDFVNGRNGAILLDFNVDGIIYDLI